MGPRNPHDLFEALERNEIVPYFQPLVELRTGVLTSFEVLARWIHPVDGMIPPDQFIPVAEETGCIGELTMRLLSQVFAVSSVVPAHVSIAVNISPLQFRQHGLAKDLEKMAREDGFPLSRLVLEVTESALMGNIMQARAIAGELKELGVRLALDDFGTGYSSLRHLQALPFDELKVDAGFVRSMGVTIESRKIAAAVVGLGQSLGLKTVAEGVETRNQAEMLLWLGCDEAQGWLYGRPVPAEKLGEIVARETLLGGDQGEEEGACGPIMPRIEAVPSQRLAHLQAIYDGVPAGLPVSERKQPDGGSGRAFRGRSPGTNSAGSSPENVAAAGTGDEACA
jgi:EAL domain-containing protein (putative c-di-GMP-specific phosphodiesterase class I)